MGTRRLIAEGAPLTKTMISPAGLEVSTARTPDLSSRESNSKRLRIVSRVMWADFCEECFTGRLTRLRSCSHTASSGTWTLGKHHALNKQGSLKGDGLQAS